jgi:RNA polymerase sigma factor (sigma-70 family)
MKSPKRQLAEKRQQETVAYLWACYAKDRDNRELRNRLVEHYTPLVQQLARQYIRRYGLRETATAIGDALLLLVRRLVPHYDGQTDFQRWASTCIRHKMLQRRKLESRNCERFANDLPEEEDDWPQIEALLVRPQEPGSDGRFLEMTAALPAREAAMLWLRFCRRLSYEQIGYAFDMTGMTAGKLVRRAIAVLREVAEPPEKELRA